MVNIFIRVSFCCSCFQCFLKFSRGEQAKKSTCRGFSIGLSSHYKTFTCRNHVQAQCRGREEMFCYTPWALLADPCLHEQVIRESAFTLLFRIFCQKWKFYIIQNTKKTKPYPVWSHLAEPGMPNAGPRHFVCHRESVNKNKISFTLLRFLSSFLLISISQPLINNCQWCRLPAARRHQRQWKFWSQSCNYVH